MPRPGTPCCCIPQAVLEANPNCLPSAQLCLDLDSQLQPPPFDDILRE